MDKTKANKMRALIKYKEQMILVIPVIVVMAVMYLFQELNLPLAVTNIFFVSTSFLYMSYWWKKNMDNKWELLIIWCAFAVRIILSLLDIYAGEYINIPFMGGDSAAYMMVAEEYYYGRTDLFCTYYPYVINAIFQFAGPNRFAAQFVNILCWCASTVIIQKSCRLLGIERRFRVLAVFLYSFMPINIIYTSTLLREAIPSMAMLYLFYCILKWMKDGKHVQLILGVIISAPGFLLHNSMLGIWIMLAFVVIFFSPSKQTFCIEKKSIYMMLLGAIGCAALAFALTKGLIAVQIPDFRNGIFEAINQRLASFYRNYGGSTYLMNEYVYDYPALVTGTIRRMLYFFCSPVPFLWRGFGDVLAFFGSTFVYIASAIVAIVSVCLEKKEPYRFVMASTMFIICGIFAWMVSNGGTAIRHREKFLGIIILLGIYSAKIIKKNWKARKGNV